MTVMSEPTWSDLVTLMHNHTQLLCTGIAKLLFCTIPYMPETYFEWHNESFLS